MKRVSLIFVFIAILKANIDLSKDIDSEEIPLNVVNISSGKFLNLRLEPFFGSKVIYKIPYDARNLVTYDRDVVYKIDKNRWVEVKVWFSEGFYIGWVKGRYLEISKRYKSICGDGVVVIYPDYLFSDRERDGSIKIYYEDTDVCGGTDIFDIQIKLYYSLLDLFTDNNFKSIYNDVAQYGWFKRGNRFAKSINIDGRRGYMRVSNSGNCKFRNYFFKINGKVLHIKERFENIGKSKRRRDILKYIIKNLRVL